MELNSARTFRNGVTPAALTYLDAPTGLTLDDAGALYVTMCHYCRQGSETDGVLVFPPKAKDDAKPKPVIVASMVRRAALLAAGWVLALGAAALPAPAALDMAVGARKVVKSQPVSSCNAAAKNALNSVLQDAAEIGTGDTGEWRAYGPADSAGHSSSSAAVHCYPLDDGYVVTFTCAVQTPDSADTASALCSKLAAAFGGGP